MRDPTWPAFARAVAALRVPHRRPDPAALLEPVRAALTAAVDVCDDATLSAGVRLRALLAHVMILAGWLQEALVAMDAGEERR
jgi:hypothetical protein